MVLNLKIIYLFIYVFILFYLILFYLNLASLNNPKNLENFSTKWNLLCAACSHSSLPPHNFFIFPTVGFESAADLIEGQLRGCLETNYSSRQRIQRNRYVFFSPHPPFKSLNFSSNFVSYKLYP